jgi:hypothetical protein
LTERRDWRVCVCRHFVRRRRKGATEDTASSCTLDVGRRHAKAAEKIRRKAECVHLVLHLLLMLMHLLLLLMMKVLLLLHHLCGGDLLRLRGGGNWILKRAIPD